MRRRQKKNGESSQECGAIYQEPVGGGERERWGIRRGVNKGAGQDGEARATKGARKTRVVGRWRRGGGSFSGRLQVHTLPSASQQCTAMISLSLPGRVMACSTVWVSLRNSSFEPEA